MCTNAGHLCVSGASIKSSSSLQILHQLEDKQKALELYLSFLKDLKLWNRVCVYISLYDELWIGFDLWNSPSLGVRLLSPILVELDIQSTMRRGIFL